MNVSTAYDIFSGRLLEKTEQPTLKDLINERAEELLENFSNERDAELKVLIKALLEGSVDGDIYNQFITDICYSQAEYELINQGNQFKKYGRY